METRKRALIAVDLDDEHLEIFVEKAAAWVHRLGLEAHLLTVFAPASYFPFITDLQVHQMVENQWEGARAKADARMQELLTAVPEPARGTANVVVGDVLPELAAAARGHVLVVVGNKPATGIQRLRHGAVAERFMRFSPVPVLVLPHPH